MFDPNHIIPFMPPQLAQPINRSPLSSVIGEEALYRFAYIPLAIAELGWDYADTIVNMAIEQGNPQTKPLSRAVRTLRREYEHVRSRLALTSQMQEELQNAYIFEEAVDDILSDHLHKLKVEILAMNPGLSTSSVYLLITVWQCDLVLKALFKYVEVQTKIVSHKAAYTVNHILPKPIYKLPQIIHEYAGDTVISETFKEHHRQYVRSLTEQMCQIEIKTSRQS